MTNEEAIKRLKQEYEGWENNHFVYEGINTYIEALKLAVNALEKERPQGEWKVYARQGGIPISDYCTNCKYEMRWYKNKYNYCPNCGAKMLNQADVE